MNLTRTALAAALAVAATHAHAADFKAGEWDLSLGGIVNAYYTHTSCSGSQAVGGLALASKALGCGGTDGRTVVGNGLLPNALTTTAKTRQEGYDISATIMIGAAVASGDAISNNSNVDVRQGFVTFGNADMGTVKLGRDYGLFGSSAILGDMTLLGAGAPISATQRNRVALGHIGSGYTYLGTYGQIAYTLPTSGAFSATVALVSPVDAGTYIGRNQPQLQTLATVKFDGGKAWVGVKHQKFEGPGNTAGFNMQGAEIGASATVGALGLAANLQTGKGLGVLSDGDSGDRKQTNLLLQATWQATAKTKLGLNWGESKLKDGVVASDLRSNQNVTAGLYYGLTKSVTLVTELSRTTSKPVSGEQAKMNGIAVGGIVFF